MFGLEAIFRNGVPVGHLRRSEYAFFIDKTLGYGYIRDPAGGVVRFLSAPTNLEKPIFFITLIWKYSILASGLSSSRNLHEMLKRKHLKIS